MKIYPAIDLQNNQCVRLYQGDFSQSTVYANDPVTIAGQFIEEGTDWLHIIDLDGAKQGSPQHSTMISAIKQAHPQLNIQLGGGIRTEQDVDAALNYGVDRVMIGSRAITDSVSVQQWLSKWGPDKIMLALDVQCDTIDSPQLMTQGWQQSSALSLWPLLQDYIKIGLKHCLCTDVKRDGTLQGPNLALYTELTKRHPTLQIQAAGGIASLSDLNKLQQIGTHGAVTGKALYEKCFTLQQAIQQVRKF